MANNHSTDMTSKIAHPSGLLTQCLSRGELSWADRQILAQYASRSWSILEFGVGASTRLVDICAPKQAEFATVDTSPDWMQRVRPTVSERVQFLPYSDFSPSGSYDMIFVDGAGRKRLEFARRTFPFLRIGGCMLLHDTRRQQDIANVLAVVREFYLEVSHVNLNERASNISVICRKIREPYVNWHRVEG